MEWKLCGLKLWSEILLEVRFSWLHVKKEYLMSKSSQAVNLEVSSKPEFAFCWSRCSRELVLGGHKLQKLGSCPTCPNNSLPRRLVQKLSVASKSQLLDE